MSYYALAAAVVAAAGTMYNNQQVADKQDNNAAAALRQQGMLQQQASAKTNALVQKTAASTDTTAKSNLLQSYLTEMNQKMGNATAPIAQVGNVSNAYTKAANDATSGISTFGNNQANLLSAIDAPSVQRQGEAADLSRYGTDIGQIQRTSQADNFLAQMRARSIAPNPWITGLTDIAGSYARTAGSGGSGGGTGLSTADGTGVAGSGAFGGSVGYAPSQGFGSLYGNFAPVYGS